MPWQFIIMQPSSCHTGITSMSMLTNAPACLWHYIPTCLWHYIRFTETVVCFLAMHHILVGCTPSQFGIPFMWHSLDFLTAATFCQLALQSQRNRDQLSSTPRSSAMANLSTMKGKNQDTKKDQKQRTKKSKNQGTMKAMKAMKAMKVMEATKTTDQKVPWEVYQAIIKCQNPKCTSWIFLRKFGKIQWCSMCDKPWHTSYPKGCGWWVDLPPKKAKNSPKAMKTKTTMKDQKKKATSAMKVTKTKAK